MRIDDTFSKIHDIIRLCHRIQKDTSGRIKEKTGISMGQGMLLDYLDKHEGLANMSHIAGHLGLMNHTVTASISRLEALGYVERNRNESADQRQIHVKLTADGEYILGFMKEAMCQFANINNTASDEFELIVSLNDTVANLEKIVEWVNQSDV